MGGGKVEPGMGGKEVGGETHNVGQLIPAVQNDKNTPHEDEKIAPADLNKTFNKPDGQKGR